VEHAVVKLDGTTDRQVSLADTVFSVDFKEPLVHQVVCAYLAGAREGTSSQKNRSAVSGGGAKPWRQKGTGRARAGTSRSPLWRGGGLTFPASHRSYAQKVNRKMYRAAIRSILSELVRQGRVRICDEIQLAEPKTARMADALGQLGVTGRTLLVTAEYNQNVMLSARNLISVDTLEAAQLDPVSLVGSENVVFTVDAVRKVEEALQ
jgi:large subunit ribosomal protein L4|tara:strand:- start:2668 stop:3288 length:621 start_codon:yes stop_codon:yes gene_type:complete